MARPGIELADVVRAYVSLLRQKREPTLCNLRLELQTGSYSTIAQHLAALRFVGRSERYHRQLHHRRRGRPRGLSKPAVTSKFMSSCATEGTGQLF